MVQWDIMQLVGIAGYFLNFSFEESFVCFTKNYKGGILYFDGSQLNYTFGEI